MENTRLQLSDLKVNNLPELQGWKEKQEKLVSENPFIEIIDNKSYEVACKSRTALLKGRTELQNQDKFIASQLTSFRKDVKSETDNLIAITLPFEEKQQSEVKRYECIKEAEKQEKERFEQDRINKIKKAIDDFESASYKIIQETTIENVELHKSMLDALVNIDFDYEEYDVAFEQSKMNIQSYWDIRCNDIQEKENQRLENERLKLEAEESNRKAKELQDKIDADNLERENKERLQKNEQFEIRKNRFLELEVELSGEYFMNTNGIVCDKLEVFNADAIGFENIIADLKKSIENHKLELEKYKQQIAKDLELSIADAELLKKENKARVKRLSVDKKIISESLQVYFADLHLETDNQETKDFVEFANTQIQELKFTLLTKLKNI